MKHLRNFFPFLLILGTLIVHVALINDYGLTWDFHHHFFAGGYFLGIKPEELEPRPLPYVAPDPRETVILPYGPLVQIIPTASWLLFFKTLHILPPDNAYHLPIILAGIAGIAVLLFFMKEAIGRTEGIIAAIFLFLTPRFFSDLHNDMKDVPSASVIALNMWLLYRLYRYRRIRDMVLASLGFMLAWNTKLNAMFIPIIFAVFLSVSFIWSNIKRAGSVKNFLRRKNFLYDLSAIIHWYVKHTHIVLRKSYLLILYFILAPLLAFLLWTLFWGDGVGQIKLMFTTFGIGTNNIEVLLNSQWYCSGKNVPWYYSLWYLSITTPLPILFLFFIGCANALYRFFVKKQPIALLLLLWATVPLSRYILPNVGVIDGVRHFEEVLFPIAALGALGATTLIQWILVRRKLSKTIKQGTIVLLSLFTLVCLVIPIIRYHPFEITYYNELVGGIRGAYGNYDLDYWGGSQKYAIQWINTHAKKDAVINIVMATNVAATYLRSDLVLRVNSGNFANTDYIVVLNRQSFFYRYGIETFLLTHTPVHTISNQGVPLVWIFDAKSPPVPTSLPWWKGVDPCIIRYNYIPSEK